MVAKELLGGAGAAVARYPRHSEDETCRTCPSDL